MPVAEVAVPLPLPGPFHYSIPDRLAGRVAVGHAVYVPFGPRRLTGYVLDVLPVPPDDRKLKDVLQLGADEPLFRPELIPLYRWIARYYGHPLGEVIRTAIPGSTRTSTRAMVTLLPEGRDALKAGAVGLDPDVDRLLARLDRATDQRLTLRGLKREDKTLAGAALKRAEKQGWVRQAQEAAQKAVTVKMEAVYALKGSARQARMAFSRPGPVRDRLIDYIERFAPVAATELKDAFPNVAGPLRALKDKDVLEITERPPRGRCAPRGRRACGSSTRTSPRAPPLRARLMRWSRSAPPWTPGDTPGSCCTESPAAARPRCTCRPPRRCWTKAEEPSSWSPRSG